MQSALFVVYLSLVVSRSSRQRLGAEIHFRSSSMCVIMCEMVTE